jgi:hypothetical protein
MAMVGSMKMMRGGCSPSRDQKRCCNGERGSQAQVRSAQVRSAQARSFAHRAASVRQDIISGQRGYNNRQF